MDTRPLTEQTWPLFAGLFGAGAVVSSCWCTWFMQPVKQFEERGGDGNRDLLHDKVRAGEPLGVLAVEDDRPVGWVAVAPRPTYARLRTMQTSKKDDSGPGAWTVTCFYTPPGSRRRGTGRLLLAAAVEYAREHGAEVIEGYPVDPAKRASSSDLYYGTLSMFLDGGFELVERRGRRALVRLVP
jgi:GNAT superfamily N-acetyltransferase